MLVKDVQKNGISSYIPQSFFESDLMCIDEFMRALTTAETEGATFFLEYRFLLLYFIPGIDVDEYIEQLPPRRKDFLTKRWRIRDLLRSSPVQEESNLIEGAPSSDLPSCNDMEISEDFQVEPDSIPFEVVTLSKGNRLCPSTQMQQEWDLEQEIIDSAVSHMVDTYTKTLMKSFISIFQYYGSLYSYHAICRNVVALSLFGSLSICCHSNRLVSPSFSRGKYFSIAGVFFSGSLMAFQLATQRLVRNLKSKYASEDD